MKTDSIFIKSLVLGAGGLAVATSCSRTADPIEHYGSPSPPATAAGGNATAAGGRPGAPSTGGSAAGGRLAAAGDGPEPMGQAGANDGPALEPGTDLCGDAPISTGATFTRRALRRAAAECAQWHYFRFEAAAQRLADELSVHAAAPTATSWAAVSDSYAAAFGRMSVMELFQFGPLSSQSESAGKDSYQGQGYRERMYAWPLAARCRVEEQVALRAYTKDMSNVLVAGRGLFALDYLLYYAAADTACSATSSTGKVWPSLSENELSLGKLEYATALGDDIVAQVQALRRAWAVDGGNFGPSFVDATGYPSEQEAMKVLAWALLYLEREVKDWKLGLPAGHTASAPISVAEAAFSGLKTAAIRENLRGFRGLFQGCGVDGRGLGFDDWLTEAGHVALAQDILGAYADAQAAADASPELDVASAQEVETLYQAVKRLTDLLKNDLFGAGSPLGLALPKGIEGDTD